MGNSKGQVSEKESAFVGQIGDRIEVNLDHVYLKWFGLYKYCLNVMKDQEGNIYIYWGKYPPVETKLSGGEFYATVKAHTEYKGKKQTQLCKLYKKKLRMFPEKTTRPAPGLVTN